MRKRYAVVAILVLLVSMIGVGCKGNNTFGVQETIVFENRTGMNGVNCYIDNVYKGTINNLQNLTVEGDYAGNRVLYADGPAIWGPELHFVSIGGGFVWTLTR